MSSLQFTWPCHHILPPNLVQKGSPFVGNSFTSNSNQYIPCFCIWWYLLPTSSLNSIQIHMACLAHFPTVPDIPNTLRWALLAANLQKWTFLNQIQQSSLTYPRTLSDISYHPFPKLVSISTLSGMSVLLSTPLSPSGISLQSLTFKVSLEYCGLTKLHTPPPTTTNSFPTYWFSL